MVCLLAALFLHDTFVLLQVPSNTELDIALTLVLAVFLFELFVLFFTEREYRGGMFFWIDLIGALSMLIDISYLLGPDATSPEQLRESSAKDDADLARAARIARLGARAGRRARVLKLMRFVPSLYACAPEDGGGNVRLARSITGRLNTVLAQRVAFLTICLVVTVPISNMFRYPEYDGSFTLWAKLLARNVEQVMANKIFTPEVLTSELQRFSNFHMELHYGPYEVCYGEPVGDGFACKPQLLPLTFSSTFEKPVRRASIREISASNFQASYDMSLAAMQESAANMASIVFVIAVMLGFGLLVSNTISVVVLTPLERMLSVVREHCQQIFKIAAGIQGDTQPEEADDSEFQLLEDVIGKLPAIAPLSNKHPMCDVFASLDSADCNVLDWGKELQLRVCGYIIRCKGSYANWVSDNVDRQTLNEFISAVERGYLPKPFHNFSHGVDVLCSVSRFLHLIGAGGFVTEKSQWPLLVAALAHDVGHLGVNNQFLIDTSHELAIKYNDKSPMEMMHCSKLFHIVRAPSCDIFNRVHKDHCKEMRKVIVECILHTDVARQASVIKDLGSDAVDRQNPGSVVSETPQAVLNALLHCADISNPMRPWELCRRYAGMVLEEFFAQGDEERRRGMPVLVMNDRTKVNMPISQVNFIGFVVAPMCKACVRRFPQLSSLADHLASNIRSWRDLWQADANPEQAEVDKVNARVQEVEEVADVHGALDA